MDIIKDIKHIGGSIQIKAFYPRCFYWIFAVYLYHKMTTT